MADDGAALSPWLLAWNRGRLAVEPVAAMMGPAEVRLDDGRVISPFAVAPWADEPASAALSPPLLRRLRGDWLCVPFGLPGKPRTDLVPEWMTGLDPALESPDPAQHGTGSNEVWSLERADPHRLALRYEPPAPLPIARIERIILVAPDDTTIEVESRVTARHRCELPWGAHPTMRLPEEPGTAEIEFGHGDATVFTYPGVFEAGVSRVAAARICRGVDAIPMNDGTTMSFRRLPLAQAAEEALLVTRHGGVARLTNYAEGYRAIIEWDEETFPALLLWVSNYGRTYAPWNGRHRALGVEPVCAPFDLGYAHAVNPSSPLRAHGIATARQFTPDQPVTTRYRFRFESL